MTAPTTPPRLTRLRGRFTSQRFSIILRAMLLVLMVVPLLAPTAPPASASSDAQDASDGAGPLLVTTTEGGVALRWQVDGDMVAAAENQPSLPLTPYAGYLLPATFVTVRSPAGLSVAAQVNELHTVPWRGEISRAESLAPAALDWEPIQSLLPAETPTLPTAPIAVVRSGTLRGSSISVIAFSQIYWDQTHGEPRLVTQMDAILPSTEPVDEVAALYATSGPRLTGAAPGPSNPLAGRSAAKILVAHEGIQELSAEDLAGVGFAEAVASRLQIYSNGTQIPLHIIDVNGNDRIDSGIDAVRFFAKPPGNRWNKEDVYWLTLGSGAGLRMPNRSVAPTDAPLRATALATGEWVVNQFYESTMAGPDGDHWFHLDAKVDPSMKNQPAASPTFTVQVKPDLPLATSAGESSVFSLTLSAYDVRRRDGSGQILDPAAIPHQLRVDGGSYQQADDDDDWLVDFSSGPVQNLVRALSTTSRPTQLKISLVPNDFRAAAKFDRVYWQQPVELDLGGGGAIFSGVDGTWRYQVSNSPTGSALYDITDPGSPALLQKPAGQNFTFQDGPAARRYLVVGSGSLFRPQIAAHSPVNLANGGADALYIAPSQFHSELNRLTDHRNSQGYQTRIVDVQTIYDSWSFGAVDPKAIRSFLRYAVDQWQPAPIAVVLVGDGTSDPHDYLGNENPNLIPPYLANVDPWLGETACENCLAQLDGDDPLSESAFLADIWLGRFPVIDNAELGAVIDKIIRYETDTNSAASWRNLAVYLADDYVRPNGQIDAAGNFPKFAENVIDLLPKQVQVVRNYYNAPIDLSLLPSPIRAFLESILDWTEGDPERALQRTINTLQAGAGTVVFIGHAHHWQWATTDVSYAEPRLFGLWDVLKLNNRDQLFIGMSMTCYTSQFTKPAPFHMTLDEHLLVHADGGAVAMWGPAGLSVAHGHDALLTGFHKALWQSEPMQAKLGSLLEAGYLELVTNTDCCQDVAHTFLLLGDPLTPARAQALEQLYMPAIESAMTVK